ncbi:MAG TPA: FtsX-like permease family protein [Candidatus Acidoferrales bacterium]|nr:FtsX-like permease family protein [Candidatus Acidoferrales bacterium]
MAEGRAGGDFRPPGQPASPLKLTHLPSGDCPWKERRANASLTAIVDSALKRADGKLRATDVRTLDENLSRSILQERMLGTLSGLFGALSLILVSVGVYGVMAFQVARRQKEIGIRMALGARPTQVSGMVLTEAAVPVVAGVAIGVAGALGITRLAEKDALWRRAHRPGHFRGGKCVAGPFRPRRCLCAEPPGFAAESGRHAQVRVI